jgi:hypothetical protein
MQTSRCASAQRFAEHTLQRVNEIETQPDFLTLQKRIPGVITLPRSVLGTALP